jgi:hypothetical protein
MSLIGQQKTPGGVGVGGKQRARPNFDLPHPYRGGLLKVWGCWLLVRPPGCAAVTQRRGVAVFAMGWGWI